jgi:hypothetical protein
MSTKKLTEQEFQARLLAKHGGEIVSLCDPIMAAIRGDSIMRSASEIILLWTLRNALAPEPKTPNWHAKENVKVVEEPMNVEGQIRVTYYLRVSTESQELGNQRSEILPFIDRRGWTTLLRT